MDVTLKQAWINAYGAITEMMLEGSDYSSDVIQLA